MALHPKSCACNACQELGFGYPAFQAGASFPSSEHWDIGPMHAPRWGENAPWQNEQDPAWGKGSMGSPYEYDPSDFGGPGSRRALGQAFVPGVVLPPFPQGAWDEVEPSRVFQPTGLPENPTAALKLLNAQGQGPDARTGIAPTLSFSQAQRQADRQNLNLNADGTLSPKSINDGIPTSWWVGGLLAYLLLK